MRGRLKLILADYEMNKTKDADAVKEEMKPGTMKTLWKKCEEKQMEKQVTINAEEQQMMNRGAVVTTTSSTLVHPS